MDPYDILFSESSFDEYFDEPNADQVLALEIMFKNERDEIKYLNELPICKQSKFTNTTTDHYQTRTNTNNNEGQNITDEDKSTGNLNHVNHVNNSYDIVYFPEKETQESYVVNQQHEKKMSRSLTLKCKRQRKQFDDGIRKKVKSHFHNHLIQKSNTLIKAYYPKLNFVKWKNEFTADITIKRNKELLNQTMKEILRLENTAQNRNSSLQNMQVLEMIKTDNSFEDFLTSSYKDQYDAYLNSISFQKHLAKVKEKEENDESYAEKYEQLAKTYISYFQKKNPNKPKKKKKKNPEIENSLP